MDFDPENQSEDGFDQIEDEQASDQEAEKLKGSSSEDENPRTADEGTVQNPASTIRICDFCGRTFNNGKALGGHRRYHLQLLRKEAAARSQKVKIRLPKTKIHNNDNNSNCVNDVEDNNILKMEALISKNNGGKGKGKPTCDLCNKDFPSMKSYYGHMRSHPERIRRAVLLPLPRSPKSDDDSADQKEDNVAANSRTVIAPVDDESSVRLTKSLPSWAKTDQRGRKSIGGAEAAQNLVYLSRGGYFSAPQAAYSANVDDSKSSNSGVSLQRKKIKVEDDSLPRKQKMRKIEACRRGKLKLGEKIDENDDGCGNGKIMDIVDKEEEKEEEGEGNADWGEEECEKTMKIDDSHLDESKMMTKKKENKRKKILKLKFSESLESEENPLIKTLKTKDGHKCKSIALFRALGEHRSSHNKEKKIKTMDELEDKNNETKGNKLRGLVVEEADTAHAFGDHHRRLNSRRSAAETQLSEEASSVGASLSPSTQELGEASPLTPRVLDFDLNEPYVTDDKEVKSTFSQE
ncbi:hypothetical protein L6164_031347 [Bauhinia variegata]|uniref:Uncharacterized protein n=1 Tax=Bauhinia variegata TaxID=167791 RepID=A0ACB9LF63_BAUVA|nr:hypothetical protein L6164_031347 [Bauhinia variegata]